MYVAPCLQASLPLCFPSNIESLLGIGLCFSCVNCSAKLNGHNYGKIFGNYRFLQRKFEALLDMNSGDFEQKIQQCCHFDGDREVY